jgi:hypothetical protein
MTGKTAPQLLTQRATLRVAQLERRTLDGREYAVAPCIAVRETVLNGQFLPADEIAYSTEGWNGRPVAVRHPKRLGAPVTANSPAVVEQQVIGTTFNARMDGDRLHVELWVDVEKCRRLGGDALAVLEALDVETPLDVSTGYFCEVEEAEGAHDGKLFRGIQHNVIPDHIAVLPDERGACSWQDGCGAPRVNSQKERNMPEETEVTAALEGKQEQVEQEQEEVTANTDAPACNAGEPAEEVASSATADVESPLDEGEDEPEEDPQGVTVQADDAAGGETWAELGSLINEMGGVEAFRTALAQVFDVAMLVQEMGGIEAVKGLFGSLKANADAKHEELVSRLAANAACAFTPEELAAMTDAQLEKLDRSLRPGNFAVRQSGPRANAAEIEWRVLDAPSTVPQA